MKFGVADYGMNVWFGGDFDHAARLRRLKEIGYEGTERLSAVSADDALQKAACRRALGTDFATCLAPTPELSIQWTAALGKFYVWANVSGKDFTTFCRQVNHQAEACARFGIKAALHNHLGTLVETQSQVESFLAQCPACGLVLDTAHLAAAGGDPAGIIRRYPDRLASMHLKDWLQLKPFSANANWWEAGRFCELGAGNIGLDNLAVMRALVAVGYDGWVFVEQDSHLRDPYADLAASRQYLRNGGF